MSTQIAKPSTYAFSGSSIALDPPEYNDLVLVRSRKSYDRWFDKPAERRRDPRPVTMRLDAEDVNEETWRQIKLDVFKPDETICHASLLRPLWWIEETGAKVGGMIHLAMTDMGVVGPAKVLAINPCPKIEPPVPGKRSQVVIGKFKHVAHLMLHIFFEGMEKPLEVTPNHPMYSLDRQDFVKAGNLRVGELLKTRKGVVAKIIKANMVFGEQYVYNLEVHRDHVFFVTKLGILTHNSYEVTEAVKDLRFRGAQVIDPLRTATDQEITNAFAGSGLKPSGHFISRVKDVRTENLGLNTFGDLQAIFKNGQLTPIEDGRLLSLVYGNFEVIINADTGTLITLKPR